MQRYETRVGSNLSSQLNLIIYEKAEASGSVVFKALCQKPEGRGFETR
jgi:hypothetical protein